MNVIGTFGSRFSVYRQPFANKQLLASVLLILFNFFFFRLTMTFVIETIIIGGIVLIWLLSRIVNFRKIFLSLILPGPIPLPILGNGLLFLNKSPAGIFN